MRFSPTLENSRIDSLHISRHGGGHWAVGSTIKVGPGSFPFAVRDGGKPRKENLLILNNKSVGALFRLALSEYPTGRYSRPMRRYASIEDTRSIINQ